MEWYNGDPGKYLDVKKNSEKLSIGYGTVGATTTELLPKEWCRYNIIYPDREWRREEEPCQFFPTSPILQMST